MKKITFILIILSLQFHSCISKNYEKPKDLISKSEMIEIMTDLYIDQQGTQIFPQKNEDLHLSLAKGAAHIMKQHQIQYSQFSESYKYYIARPEELNEMLDKVRENIEEKFSEEEKERHRNKENTTLD